MYHVLFSVIDFLKLKKTQATTLLYVTCAFSKQPPYCICTWHVHFISRLDPALIRPGRVDVKEKIDYATDTQLQHMFLRFYPDQPKEIAQQFSKSAMSVSQNISLAQVQGLFLRYKLEPETVLQNVDQLSSSW